MAKGTESEMPPELEAALRELYQRMQTEDFHRAAGLAFERAPVQRLHRPARDEDWGGTVRSP